jgi:predicted nucleotide-binding protein
MAEASQPTLGLLRRILEELQPQEIYSQIDSKKFWKGALFDFGFSPAVIDIAASYDFRWGDIISDLFVGRFGDKNSHFSNSLQPYQCEQTLGKLLAFALKNTQGTPLGDGLREALASDGLVNADSEGNLSVPTDESTFAQRVVRGIDELRKELVKIRQSDQLDEHLQDTKLKTWTNRVYEQLKDWGFLTEAEQGFGRNSSIIWYDGVDKRAKMRDDRLKALRDDVASHPEHYENKVKAPAKPPTSTKAVSKLHKIFLGHGRNKLWARVQIYLKDELKLDVEAWESNARAGLHSVDVLKSLLDSCTFAVIVATGEDATADGGVRPRQNVVHEIGLFQGRFGFDKVALLRQEGIEEFSNIAGLQVIPFAGDRIEAAFYELRRMLEREGIIK